VVPKTHELLEPCRRGRVCELDSAIDRREVKTERKVELLPKDVDCGRLGRIRGTELDPKITARPSSTSVICC
jgi:hypothetical protein